MLNIRRSAHLMCIALFILCGLQRASCQYQHYVDTLRANELYEYIDTSHPIKYLQNGDSEFDSLLLDNPISFYSEKYDQIFINTNGILTFNIDFPDYINQPLPLEYPSIAPFYANVDTSSSGSISIFESQNEEQLQRANSLVRYAYVDKAEFTATRLIVATWKDVGYFNSKTDKLNTFQVVLIFNDEETFVQFIYPSGGLNWLRAETGESGFPDIRAQAGFVAEDGRFHTLEDSGSDHVKFLSDNTNVGVGGVWLYRVGAFDYTDNVESPTNAETLTEPPMREQQTCAEGSHRFCDAEASCFDKSSGFCCVCQEGFYGNGRVCLKDNIPIRVAGTINGQINGQPIDERAKLQSYVSTSDAHTYTAITPASAELASQLRLALPLITTIGWLFAKPVGGVLNGYQLTGGELSHTAQIHFETGEVLVVNQTFEGLDYWDQLSVKIDLFGDVPHVNYAAKLVMPEFIEEFRFVSQYELQSMHSHVLEIPEENRQISFQLDQHIRFERCLLDSDADPTDTKFMQKSSKLVFDYLERDQAWRPSVLTKVGVDVESNACTDGTAICGENTVCVPYEDIFRCDCLHGYAPEVDETGYERCVDIDECAQGTHVCDENAWCTNNEGGFSCVCFEGYEGNGYRCLLNNTADNIESSTRADPYQPGYQQPSYGQEYEGNSNNEVDRSREDDRYGNGNDDRYGNGNEDRYGNGNEDPYGNGNDDRYSNNNDDRYPSNNDDRYDDRYANNNDVEHDRQHSVYDQHVSTYDSKMDDCTRCSPDANCIDGRCECREGFEGNGFSCQQICGHDKVWENGNCVPIIYEDHEVEPVCTIYGDCECKEGYELVHERQMCRYIGHYETDSKPEDLVPCDVDDNCHANATCEWFAQLESHMCTCNPGFYGDGYQCVVLEESCAIKPEICDANADCNYNDATGKSECSCRRGYVGDGFHCQLAPECQADADCGLNSYCDNGVCQCNEGFERDVSDTCLPAGRCGAVFCGANSVCKWDAQQGVQYCECMDGYEGDAVEGCRSIPPPCNVRNNCGVHATCEPTEDPRRYECQCNAGYHGDGYVCIEEQNCLNNPHMCDMNAQCASTNSGLVCVCNQGFYGNGSVCFERQQYESGFLLVSQGVVIVRVPLNGKRVRPISVASMAIGLDKDCLEGRIYWGDISAKKIISAKYDGTDARDFITEDIESPEGIAIDSSSRRIYWTDSVKDTIEVASLEDPQMRAVLVNKNLVNPRGIAVDAFRQKLYWSDWNREDPKIEMSDLDGTGREILLGSDSVTLPNSLVVLARSGELCYADAGTKKVECIDSYSKQKRTISNELTYPFGLTFTQNNFYWTDWFTKKLESVDAFGERQKGIQTSFFGSHKMYGMTAIDNECPQIDSPCQINNGGCTDSRICLVNHKAPSGKSCKCTASSQLCPVSTLYAAPVAAAAPAAP